VTKPEFIILEENCDGYGGYLKIDKDKLTDEFIESIKKDKADKMRWKKYRKVMKKAGYDIERVD